MSERDVTIKRFIAKAGWGEAARHALAGDASTRRYERLVRATTTAMLMDSPSGTPDDPADFVRISTHLRSIGLNAPEILFQDLERGLLLLEDFGDDTFARVLVCHPEREQPLYALACDVLLRLQSNPPASGLSDLTAIEWANAAMLSLEWYRFAITGDRQVHEPLRQTLAAAMHAHADGPRVMILRDYHAENLMSLPDRMGLAKVGVLDFQLAQMGQPGYDLVSLLQDARRDVAPTTETAMIMRFCAATETDPARFTRSYAALGVQRALRLLGVFTRLCLVVGKPGYLDFMPRVWGQMQRNLAALDLAPLTELCNSLLPAPDAETLDIIARKCARHPPL